MTTFILRDSATWKAFLDHVMELRNMEKPWQVELREYVRTRTTGQNSRYWATLTEEMRQLGEEIASIARHTGYSPLEVRRLVATTLEPEQIAILYAHTPEAVHDILKTIHGIPTSTRLGTKDFMAFEERMIATVAEVVGAVKATEREAA